MPDYMSVQQRRNEEERRTMRRKKDCPQCRAKVDTPPVEVWLMKGLIERVSKSMVQGDADDADRSGADLAELKGQNLPAGQKVWEGECILAPSIEPQLPERLTDLRCETPLNRRLRSPRPAARHLRRRGRCQSLRRMRGYHSLMSGQRFPWRHAGRSTKRTHFTLFPTCSGERNLGRALLQSELVCMLFIRRPHSYPDNHDQ